MTNTRDDYHEAMDTPADLGLPTHMTWDELDRLPEHIARQVELHEGRVVLVRSAPDRHQVFSRRLVNALEACARAEMEADPGHCWRVTAETNVFFNGDKSDFRTPDFMVYRCQNSGGDDIHAHDVLLAGEVLSPSNSCAAIEAKKAKYAAGGIRWYWEVHLNGDAIAVAHAYALVDLSATLPDGVVPLRPRNYVLTGEWTPGDTAGVTTGHPFPIEIAWDALAF